MVLEMGPLGKLGHEGGALINGMSTLTGRNNSLHSLSALCHTRIPREGPYQKEGPYEEPDHAGNLKTDFFFSRTVRKKMSVIEDIPVYGTVL